MDFSTQSAVKAASLVVVIAGAFYLLLSCIYRFFFHPLAKYPGPLLGRVTNLYGGYHAWKGDIHLDMWACHEKYGEFVRYKPNSLLVNTATGSKDIYSSGKNFTKSKNYQAMVHGALNTLTLRDRKEHNRRRRIVSQGVSDSAIREYEADMLVLVNKFCDCLVNKSSDNATKHDGWQPAQDMSIWTSYLFFDIMSDLIFGRAYDLLTKETYRYVVKAIEASNVRVSVLIQAPSLRLFRLDKYLFPGAVLSRNLFVRFVGKLLRDSSKLDPLKKKSFFNFLSTAKDPQTGTSLRKEEIQAESTTLVVAGTDTSATTAASVFFYLSRNAESYAMAANEVRSVFSSVEDIRLGARLNSCFYLRACVDESMRISPPVGSALWREALSGGAIVHGELIPEGCDAGVSIYSIHHNHEYFPDPFVFKPERWILGEGKTSEESLSTALSAFMPFSTGARSCIGRSMALGELMLTMATVLWRLDFKMADGDVSGGNPSSRSFGRHRAGEFQLKDHVTSANQGPCLMFRERRV